MSGRISQGGRGYGRGQSGRGRGRGSRPYNSTFGQKYYGNLKGACEELKDNVYTVGDAKQADRFTKTTENIVNYIQRTYDEGQDVMDALVNLEDVDFDEYEPESDEAEADLTYMQKLMLQARVKEFMIRKNKYQHNMNKAYALILGQCTQGLKNKLETSQKWEAIKKEHNPIWLLKAIKEITQDYQDSKYPIASICRSLETVFTIKQDEREGLAAYIKRFKIAQDIMEIQHGTLDMSVYVSRMPEYNEDSHEELTKEAYNKLMAYLLIKGADPKRSGDMLINLANDFALGANLYPENLEAASSALANYQSQNKGRNNNNSQNNNNNNRNANNNNRNNEQQENKMGFAQKGTKWIDNITCYNCQGKGHFAKDCPKKQQATSNAQTDNPSSGDAEKSNNINEEDNGSKKQTNFFISGISIHNTDEGKEHLKRVALLDNQSTTDIFCNKDYLRNIRKVDEALHLNTNAGTLVCNKKGELPGYGEVWFDERAIANVISFSNAEQKGKYDIAYEPGTGFVMKNKENGNVNIFKKDNTGLFTTPMEKDINLLNTVDENKKYYTKRQVDRAEVARKLYQVIGYPSVRDYKHIIQTNQIKNCPVTIEDINISEKIFGPDVYAIKGKSVRKKPKVVVNDYIEIPKDLIKAHKGIVLCADIMFIDQVGFLVTMSKYIKFITIRYIKDRKKETLLEAMDDAFIKYNTAGFVIKELHADPEFECIKEEMEINDIKVNLTAAEEHQSDIERLFRVIKERYRAMYHRCPYAMWPKIMVIRGASEAVKWLNTFPPKGGISTTYSPRAIITGRPVDYNKHVESDLGVMCRQ